MYVNIINFFFKSFRLVTSLPTVSYRYSFSITVRVPGSSKFLRFKGVLWLSGFRSSNFNFRHHGHPVNLRRRIRTRKKEAQKEEKEKGQEKIQCDAGQETFDA